MSKTMTDYLEEIKKENSDTLYQEEDIEEQVMRIIREKGVSYPTEIANQTLKDPSTIKKVLSAMQRMGKVKRLNISSYKVPKVLRKRFSEFWSRNIKGFGSFRKMNLVVPSEHEVEYEK